MLFFGGSFFVFFCLVRCGWLFSHGGVPLSVQPACASQMLQCKVSSPTPQVLPSAEPAQQILSWTLPGLIQTGESSSLRFVGLDEMKELDATPPL